MHMLSHTQYPHYCSSSLVVCIWYVRKLIWADLTFTSLSEVYDVLQLLCVHTMFVFFFPEVFFHCRVLGACFVTTDWILSMSLCASNNNQHQRLCFLCSSFLFQPPAHLPFPPSAVRNTTASCRHHASFVDNIWWDASRSSLYVPYLFFSCLKHFVIPHDRWLFSPFVSFPAAAGVR